MFIMPSGLSQEPTADILISITNFEVSQIVQTAPPVAIFMKVGFM
jgi:hypothetical protein